MYVTAEYSDRVLYLTMYDRNLRRYVSSGKNLLWILIKCYIKYLLGRDEDRRNRSIMRQQKG